MNSEQIENTEWAKAFKKAEPSQYEDAIKIASCIETVSIRLDDSFSKKGDYYHAVVSNEFPDFILQAFRKYSDAKKLVKTMGWKLKNG